MKTLSKKSLLATLLLVLALSPTWGQSQKHLAIALEQTAPLDSRVVVVRTEVKNISKTNVEIGSLSPAWEYSITALGPDALGAPFTATWKKLRSGEILRNGSQADVTLAPLQAASQVWNLSDYVDFSRSGGYRVSVKRKFETIGETDSSNIIEVRITRKE